MTFYAYLTAYVFVAAVVGAAMRIYVAPRVFDRSDPPWLAPVASTLVGLVWPLVLLLVVLEFGS